MTTLTSNIAPSIQIPTTGNNIGISTGASNTAWINSQYSGYATTADYQPKIVIKDTPLTHEYSESEGKTFQHEVAVIKVTRNDEGEIIKSKMVKVFWVETKTQGSIDYAASKDPEVSELEPEDIIIKTLRTIRL